MGGCPGYVEKQAKKMSSTEALRTQNDSLRHLDVENHRLRLEKDAASKLVDMEAELQRVKQDSTELSRAMEALTATLDCRSVVLHEI